VAAALLVADGAAEQRRTLATYIANDCNMNATAAAMPSHRHTVAYRLERIRELTGLDPLRAEDREQLGVALKARAVVRRLAGLATVNASLSGGAARARTARAPRAGR
jgi:sugar diacid utilization regulator